MFKSIEFSNELYTLLYGEGINVSEIEKLKTRKEIWDDIILFIANNDITKVNEIREMNFIECMNFLNSKVKTMLAKKHLIQK